MARIKEIIEDENYTVEVMVSVYGGVTREADPDDEWGRDSTWTSHDVRGIRFPSSKQYGYTVTVPFKPKVNTDYYLLVAQYSTGDSFGSDDGANFEIIGLYQSKRIAEENLQKLEATRKDVRSVTLTAENGKKYTFAVPWNGYFESLDYVELHTVRI
jgi:hypothetical protein